MNTGICDFVFRLLVVGLHMEPCPRRPSSRAASLTPVTCRCGGPPGQTPPRAVRGLWTLDVGLSEASSSSSCSSEALRQQTAFVLCSSQVWASVAVRMWIRLLLRNTAAHTQISSPARIKPEESERKIQKTTSTVPWEILG